MKYGLDEIKRFSLFPDEEAESIIREAYFSLTDKSWFAVNPEAHLPAGNGYLYKAYVDGETAGILVVLRPGLLASEFGISGVSADMDTVAVKPVFQGRSLMRRMMEMAEHDLKEDGIDTFLSTVHPENLPSRHTMEKMGYKKVFRGKMYGGFDRLLMMHRC